MQVATRSRSRWAWALLSLVLLCALFEAPALLLQEPVRPTAELFLLVSLWLFSDALGARAGQLARAGLGVLAAALVLYRIDVSVFTSAMGERPLLYDQLFMLHHLLVLIGDVWSATVAAVLAGVLLSLAGVFWLVRRLLRSIAVVREPGRERTAYVACAVLWIALGAGSLCRVGGVPAVRFMTPGLAHDLRESHAIYARVQRGIGAWPYQNYRSLHLTRTPDVYLVFFESYGQVLTTHPSLRPRYRAEVERIERDLRGAGWSMASAFSDAPVMGGRSWLAEGSVLMGAHVGYEALFRNLIEHIARLPNLVSFLAGQGYETIQLAPADRVRPGVEKVNYYHYQRSIGFDDLHYSGPRVGWGIVPDQYSLEYVDTNVLQRAAHPLYFELHTVTSHAPWPAPPPLVADFHSLARRRGRRPRPDRGNATWLRLRRYTHARRRFLAMGNWRTKVGRNYERTVIYDLNVLERFLASKQRDAIAIVIGDHQPPFVAAQTRSFATPVHVLARDPALLSEFLQHGFRSGLWLGPEQSLATVRHEGMFSLLVRALSRCCGDGSQPVPPYLPAGAPLDG